MCLDTHLPGFLHKFLVFTSKLASAIMDQGLRYANIISKPIGLRSGEDCMTVTTRRYPLPVRPTPRRIPQTSTTQSRLTNADSGVLL
jgi:hypothetical protein